ncbi:MULTISPECIES: hemolysin family protein [unclassified Campylobacter]|uniref:hemolysin family protein n=1 Tax=unclassified Campylobacter TaxID=2593542 RepID=UPI001237D50F|nr:MULTISPECIES: hemolysin family protein [unclassified Campylobacter]KAA6225114.1 HlyC/CorC family transporter [Campylobacter sp. LR196d]KAA6226128.1 HlyC/CorC family transporter [Campylobacter sp. LR185c]KAA6228075.1 HlyC/CorC family transporter [Campylobacter sp. LR286c]KAA6231328.1 HlyC/CorC family transporter [Campylobacter sp. LR264d]KAA6231540.1 HlyC/CorC family transporter [Campylobacter sp. LR291e]
MDPSQFIDTAQTATTYTFNVGYSSLMIFIAFVLVFLNGFFVLSEFSIVKVRRSKLEEFLKEKRPNAKMALKVTSKLDTYLSACQLGITLSSLALGWIGEPALASMLETLLSKFHTSPVIIHSLAFIIAFSAITLLHVVLGELVPKSIAIAIADRTVLWVARPLHWFWLISFPCIKIFDILAALALKVFGIKPAKEYELTHSEEEIKFIASESQKGGVLDEFETEIIRNAVDFSDTMAKEVMTPRRDMICLDKQNSYEENLKILYTHQHTRFPCIDGSKDCVVGMIHIRDIVKNELSENKAKIDDFIKPLIIVPENISISKVLVMMNKERSHVALVIDEYGGTAGILTMEDILEEIIGEIKNENEEDSYKKISDDVYEFQGRCDIEQVEELLLISYDKNLEQVTIGGYVFNLLGRLPVVGDIIDDELCTYEVCKMDANSIELVKVTKKPTIE